jgi:thiosulfate/3-mercaptopyruvate sulfurtransferase
MMSNLISLKEAFKQFQQGGTVFLDTRFVFGSPEEGQRAYLEDHIPGAVYLDLNRDLSGPILEHGGRHPLPDASEFAAKLGQAGVGADSKVIVYDDQNSCLSARLWWMLRYYGHEQVKVLNVNYAEWKKAGYPVDADLPRPVPQVFQAEPQPDFTADVQEVKAGLCGDKSDVLLIDSRTPGSYTGEQPTKYPVNGHIPGAVNYYWKEGVDPAGEFMDAAAQRVRFAALPLDTELIIYCNAGVSACPNVLALSEAGYPKVKLYVGSWGDWISYEGNDIATRG